MIRNHGDRQLPHDDAHQTRAFQNDQILDAVDMLMGARAAAHKERVMKNVHENLDVTRGTHGTSSRDGMAPSMILPAAEHGGYQSFPDLSDAQRAYYTAPRKDGRGLDVSHEGWNWAYQSQANRSLSADGPKARTMVAHVTPASDNIDVDKNLNSHGKDQQLTADKLHVTDVEWIPPVNKWADSSWVGVQGTLPNENWNKYPSTEKPYEDQNFKGLQNPHAFRHTSGFNAPRVNEEQFAPIKPVEGQMEMFDRPPTWYDEGRKADI